VLLEVADVAFLEAHGKTREIAASTWRRELETLRAFFAWCVEQKWITDNPAERLRMPRVEDLSTLPLTAEEIDRLIAACDQIASDNPGETPYIRRRARALALTLLYTSPGPSAQPRLEDDTSQFALAG
jgi:site-specific recombinase XerD